MNYHGALASRISDVLDLNEHLVPLVRRPKAAVNHSNLRILVCRGLASSGRTAYIDLRPFMFRGPLLLLQGATLIQSSPQSHTISCAGVLQAPGGAPT